MASLFFRLTSSKFNMTIILLGMCGLMKPSCNAQIVKHRCASHNILCEYRVGLSQLTSALHLIFLKYIKAPQPEILVKISSRCQSNRQLSREGPPELFR